MPETPLSPVEVAHHMTEHGHAHERSRRLETVVEIIEVVVLALVAIATAWSGYQAAQWNGEESERYAAASRTLTLSNRADLEANQQVLYDTTTFDSWVAATSTGDESAAALFERRFRPEYRPAFDAWTAAGGLDDPDAPPGPIFMPEYRLAKKAEARRLEARSNQIRASAHDARETGDDYVRDTVLLATVLFLIAVSQRFRIVAVRVAVIGLAAVILFSAVALLVSLPRL